MKLNKHENIYDILRKLYHEKTGIISNLRQRTIKLPAIKRDVR